MPRPISRRTVVGAALAAPMAVATGCRRSADEAKAHTPRAGGQERFGVVAHLERFPAGDLPGILGKVTKLGIGSIRGVVFPWSHIEAPRGHWKWEATDAQIEAVEQAGLNPIGHLGPSASWASSLDPSRETNPWGWSDYPPDDMTAWREYVRRIVNRYAGRIRIWSPYNEPDNLDLFGPPRDRADERDPAFLARRREAFLAMQEITFSEGKRADPRCIVLSGAFSIHGHVDRGFIPWLMDNGCGRLFDVFDVHAYDTLGAIRSSVMLARRLMDRHGISKPVWMTEVGAAVRGTGRGGRPFTSDDAADFIPKALATALALGVERVFWYQGYHDGASGRTLQDPAHSLITAEGPTPAAQRFAQTVRVLDGCRYAGPMPAAILGGRAVGHLFTRTDRRVLIAWAEAPDGLPNSPARAEGVLRWQGRIRRLSLTQTPIILSEGVAHV